TSMRSLQPVGSSTLRFPKLTNSFIASKAILTPELSDPRPKFKRRRENRRNRVENGGDQDRDDKSSHGRGRLRQKLIRNSVLTFSMMQIFRLLLGVMGAPPA